MTCSTCLHWEEYKDSVTSFPFGRCHRMKMYDEVAHWNDKGERELKDPTTLAWVEDGSSYFAAFYTLPTFSCCLGELK